VAPGTERVRTQGNTNRSQAAGLTSEEIVNSLTRILRDILGNDSIVLTTETRREDVAGWDSFNYVTFIAAVEIELGVKFKVAEVESFENVGAIVLALQRMLN
jgi:acyl carrier protein